MIVEDKKLREPAFDYGAMIVWGSVPIVLFIIVCIILLFHNPRGFFQVFPGLLGILAAFVASFALLGASLHSKLAKIVLKDIKKPIYITCLLFFNAFVYSFFLEKVREVFGESDFSLLIKYWWLIAIIWLTFPIIEIKKIKNFYNRNLLSKRLSYIVRLPIYIIIVYSIFAFVMLDGVALFSKVFTFVICHTSYFCKT